MIPRSKSWGPGSSYDEVVGEHFDLSNWVETSRDQELAVYEGGSISGFDIPGYHEKLRSGVLLPMTPFTKVEEYSEVVSSNGQYWSDSGHSDRWTPATKFQNAWTDWRVNVNDDIMPKLSTVDINDFVQSAAARIYASGWDALTFAGELGKTITMFASFKKNLFRHLNRGNYKDLSKIWLEARYGWRPLIYDIQDIIKVVNTLDTARKRFSERTGTTLTGHSEWNDYTNRTFSQDGEYVSYSDAWTLSVRGMVVADLEPPKIQLNPIVTAWELIPFSFVVDWFVSVGTWLESMSFLALATNYTAATGAKVEYTRNCSIVNGSVATGWSSSDFSSSSISTVNYSFRSPATIPSLPQPRVNLDVGKLVDLAALARALRK